MIEYNNFKEISLILALIFVFNVAVANGRGDSVWPMPQAIVVENTYAIIPPSFTIASNLVSCDVLDQAIERYLKVINQIECVSLSKNSGNSRGLTRSPKADNKDELSILKITVRGACEYFPTETMNEKYALQIHTPSTFGTAELIAASVWGALRGLETFSQLVYEIEESDSVKLAINTSSVIDFPRFEFRGLLLDTSRHFLPVNVILDNLEAMAQNKLNVFHWHIVDDQSFPYQSKLYPDLSGKGAFDKNHVYSQEDVAKVIEYARVRGIRVIPEFDTPGHSQSWGKGQSNLLTPCYKGGVPDGTFGPINPIRNDTYSFIESFFGEISEVFPDNYLHLGGDEVSFSCWKTNPDILDFMKTRHMGNDFSKVQAVYEQKIVAIAQNNLNKTTVVWQEVLDNKVPVDKSTIIHVWKDNYKPELAKVTAAGYTTIFSSCWYLNKISYGVDWHPYYTCDPQDFTGNATQKNLVIGGAAAMWGEFVDGTGVMSRTWPRASTVAERLWSDSSLKDFNAAAPRLLDHRCRMLQRGLRVEPPNGPGFCTCDPFI